MNTHFYIIDGILIILLSIGSLLLINQNRELKQTIANLEEEKTKEVNQIEVNNPETL